MRLQNVFTIVALVALAALVGLVVRSVVASHPRATQATNVAQAGTAQSNLPQIWVARQTLQTGSFLDPSELEAHDWPQAALLPNQLKVSAVQPGDITGAVVRDTIRKGEPILMSKLVRPGERGFLAAVLLPGMRAITVGVDAVSANSGLVLPGDRVDIILTQNLGTSDGGSAGRAHVSETIARAVRVLAVGKDLVTPQDSKDVDDRPRTVTLEVTPRQSEQIAVATVIGDIRLALRSLPATVSDKQEDELATTDADLTKPSHPIWANDVSKALGAGGSYVSVMRGSSTSNAR